MSRSTTTLWSPKKQISLTIGLVGATVIGMAVSAPATAAQLENPLLQVTPNQLESIPGLRLTLVATKPQYALGEPIEIIMRYTFEGEGELNVTKVDFDRSGRVSHYTFNATDTQGKPVRDPAPQLQGQSGGGARYQERLSRDKPFKQQVVINQWLSFDTPGAYILTARSRIISSAKSSNANYCELESPPISIQIIEPNEASRRIRLDAAQAAIQIEDRQVDRINRETRFEAVRDLRFMQDERTIPLLVRALSDGFVNVRNEADLGLLAFQDLSSVRAELLRVIKDETTLIQPSARSYFMNLLREANKRSPQPLPQNEFNTFITAYSASFQEKLERQLHALPPARAAELTVLSMQNHQMDSTLAANWNRVLLQASAMSTDAQSEAAERLLYVISVKTGSNTPIGLDELAKMKNALHQVAQVEQVLGDLRLAALLALHREGDDSLQELLFQDVLKFETKILRGDEGYVTQAWAAREVMGQYRAQEITPRLIEMLDGTKRSYTPGIITNFVPWRSLIRRIRDFGTTASAVQLTNVYARVEKELGNRDYNGDLKYILLQAIVRVSPEDAVTLIRDFPRPQKGAYGSRQEVISNLLTRIPTVSARSLMNELLISPDEQDRTSVIAGLGNSVEDAENKNALRTQFLSPQPDFAISYVPRIIQIFETDPAPNVRARASYSLGQITHIPPFVIMRDTTADDKQYLNQWKEWWKRTQREAQELH